MSQTNLNPIAWRKNRKYQAHRLWYAYGEVFKHICPAGRFFPFQLVKGANNADISSFVLNEVNTGATYDVLSDMQATGLFVDREYYENYSIDNITSQERSSPTGATKWGWSIGAPESFRFLLTKVESATLFSAVRCVIKTSSTGTEIASADVFLTSLTIGQTVDLEFDFGAIIENTDNDNLWIELRANGQFWTVGKDGAYVPAPTGKPHEQDLYGTDTDITVGPAVDAPGSAQEYSGFVRLSGGGDETVTYTSSGLIATSLPIGVYEATMSDGASTWYSEYYTIVEDADCFPKITYWHRENFDAGDHTRIYESGYRDWLYLYSQGFIKPRYVYEQEVKSRGGVNFKNLQVSYKQGRMVFVAPEWLLDAIRLIWMVHDVEITYHGTTYKVSDITFGETWGEQGHLATVECVFRSDDILIVQGNNLPPLPEPAQQGTVYYNPAAGVYVMDETQETPTAWSIGS